jgi:hypothetical protein
MTYSGSRENNVFGIDSQHLTHNEDLWRSLFSNYEFKSVNIGKKSCQYIPNIQHDQMVNLLSSIRRPPEPTSDASEALFISFLKGNECKITTWTILMPQLQAEGDGGKWNLSDSTGFRVIGTNWKYPGLRLNTIAGSKDRLPAWVLSDNEMKLAKVEAKSLAEIPQAFIDLKSKNRAVVLLYPIRPPGHKGIPILGFECVLPNHPVKIGWAVIDPNQDSPRVPALSTQST